MAVSGVSGRNGIVGTVRELVRFPVKSTAGESVAAVALDERGLVADREWAVYTADGGIASGKTTRRFRRVDGLMTWRSTLPAGTSAGSPVPMLHGPDGRVYRVDDHAAGQALSEAFGRQLTPHPESTVRHHDESGVHLVTTSSLHRTGRLVGSRIDARRVRANILLDTELDGFLEDSWIGAELEIGAEVVLRLGEGMPRCVMLDRPQAGVAAHPPALRPLGQAHNTLLGLQAHVIQPGVIRSGDQAYLNL